MSDDAPPSPPSRGRGVGPSLEARALRHLANREHSRAELMRKLGPHAESAEQLEALLDKLERLGYLSAERVVASVIHRKAARLGSARIRQELAAKGLNPADHGEALAALRASEFERAQQTWRRRFGEAAPGDARERARQARFLQSRGFPADIVTRIVRGLGDPGADD